MIREPSKIKPVPDSAYFSFRSLGRDGPQREMWVVCQGQPPQRECISVFIEYDAEWYSREGSINDLRAMAFAAAAKLRSQQSEIDHQVDFQYHRLGRD